MHCQTQLLVVTCLLCMLVGCSSKPAPVTVTQKPPVTAASHVAGAQGAAQPSRDSQKPAAIPPGTKVNSKDGAAMVYVPAGDFVMGATDDQVESWYQSAQKVIDVPRSAFADAAPQHDVYLDGYWIYKTPVTVAQYKQFCTATGHQMPAPPDWGWKDDHPIVNVTWSDAQLYCKWAGKRLPTEAQWEKAARGTKAQVFPWGNDYDETRLQCSKNTPSDAASTAPVGSFPSGASPYGCLDMAGNAWQWCADWYGADYYKTSPKRNPSGPNSGEYRVIRGGSWRYGGPISFMFSAATRGYRLPDGTASATTANGIFQSHDETGFRCVEGS